MPPRQPAALGAPPDTRILTPMARKEKQQSDTPKKPGRLAQVRQVFTAARKADPTIPWWMLLAFIAVVAVGVGIGVLVGHWKYALFLSIPLALLAATLVLSRKAERAAYRSLEGQPGAAGAALGALRRGWFFDQQPVAVDGARGTRPEDMVGRGLRLPRPGPSRDRAHRRGPRRPPHQAARPGAQEGRAGRPRRPRDAASSWATPTARCRSASSASKLTRMKPVLTKEEVSAVNKRLKSLGGLRPPIPAGMDPMRARVDRKAMRGR